MKPIVLSHEMIHRGSLVLVNERCPLSCDYQSSLIPIDKDFPDILMHRDAANILRFVLERLPARDSIVPVSGYRSYEEQMIIFNDSMREKGADFTRRYVAMPNHSEHQTGLAIDLALKSNNIDFICPDFPHEGICEAFRKTAVSFGFIERYKKGKEAITGIAFEPWHFRFVGYPHSKIMEEYDLSLEEYIDFLKDTDSDNPLAYGNDLKERIEVFYAPSKESKTEIVLPNDDVYQISGNNVDGFIVTLWRKAK